MARITLFSWGYWGWGRATRQFVNLVDAVERKRGFKPPVFVDIRYSRGGRAWGFQGDTFERLVGSKRYLWRRSLGNRRIATKSGPKVRIHDPHAAAGLLDLANDVAKDGRRIIFFCNCLRPRLKGKTSCHRSVVSKLLLDRAKHRGQRVEVVEWPGGKPTVLRRDVAPSLIAACRNGSQSLPLGPKRPPHDWAALPWGSIVHLEPGEDRVSIMTGPAFYTREQWFLPVEDCFSWYKTADLKREAGDFRRYYGYEPLRS